MRTKGVEALGLPLLCSVSYRTRVEYVCLSPLILFPCHLKMRKPRKRADPGLYAYDPWGMRLCAYYMQRIGGVDRGLVLWFAATGEVALRWYITTTIPRPTSNPFPPLDYRHVASASLDRSSQRYAHRKRRVLVSLGLVVFTAKPTYFYSQMGLFNNSMAGAQSRNWQGVVRLGAGSSIFPAHPIPVLSQPDPILPHPLYKLGVRNCMVRVVYRLSSDHHQRPPVYSFKLPNGD